MNNRTEEKLKDLSGMQKAVSELLQQAWERGYKYCEAEHEEQTKKNPGFYVGDVVKFLGYKGIIVGLSYDGKQSIASVYTRNSVVPQKVPLEDLITTGQHVNVSLEFLNQALIDISGGKEE